jgi:hypothetical protein
LTDSGAALMIKVHAGHPRAPRTELRLSVLPADGYAGSNLDLQLQVLGAKTSDSY